MGLNTITVRTASEVSGSDNKKIN